MKDGIPYACALLVVFVLASSACGVQSSTPLAPTEQPSSTPTSPGSVVLNGARLHVTTAQLDRSFPPGCTGTPPACIPAQDGHQFLAILFVPVDLPEGQVVAYKQIPSEVVVESSAGETSGPAERKYDAATRNLLLGFQVPAAATGYTLHWPGSEAIALNVGK
jgi:hypothetical protein